MVQQQCCLRLPLAEAQLVAVDARQDPHGNQGHGRPKDPRFNLQRLSDKSRVSGRAECAQKQKKIEITTGTVPFPHGLCLCLAAKDGRRGPHGEADQILTPERQRQEAAERSVEGSEMFGIVPLLVEIDGDEAGGKEQKGGAVEVGVDSLADAFLTRSVRRLQDKNRLDQE